MNTIKDLTTINSYYTKKSNNTINVSIDLVLHEHPENIDDLYEIICNEYIKSKGVNKSINQILYDTYPEKFI